MIVYIATNKVNGKVYIGQTIKTIARRKMQHLGDTKRGSRLPFHNAIRKYGKESFGWEVIYTATNLQDLNEAEEYLIAEYNARVKGYNIGYGGSAGGTFSGRHHAAATKARMSAAQSGEKNSMFGKSQ